MTAMLNTWARRAYLALLCAEGYEDQETAAYAARWYHLPYLLVPILGPLLFVVSIEETGLRMDLEKLVRIADHTEAHR